MIIVIVVVTSENKKSTLDNNDTQLQHNVCESCDQSCKPSYTYPVTTQPVTNHSDEIMESSVRRTGMALQKLNRDRALSSVNKATKMHFGRNVYDEITTYE